MISLTCLLAQILNWQFTNLFTSQSKMSISLKSIYFSSIIIQSKKCIDWLLTITCFNLNLILQLLLFLWFLLFFKTQIWLCRRLLWSLVLKGRIKIESFLEVRKGYCWYGKESYKGVLSGTCSLKLILCFLKNVLFDKLFLC